MDSRGFEFSENSPREDIRGGERAFFKILNWMEARNKSEGFYK